MNARIRAVFEDAGVRGWLHAVALDEPDATVEVDADGIVPLASVYKLPLLAGFCRLVDLGELDPRAQLTLDPSTKTGGPTGLSPPFTMDFGFAKMQCLVMSVPTRAARAPSSHTVDDPRKISNIGK